MVSGFSRVPPISFAYGSEMCPPHWERGLLGDMSVAMFAEKLFFPGLYLGDTRNDVVLQEEEEARRGICGCIK